MVEVKKNGFFYKKEEAVEKISQYIQTFEASGAPWLYITFAENQTLWPATEAAIGKRAFRLSITNTKVAVEGAWDKFINSVIKHLKGFV